jgi:ribonuclease Z
MKVPAVTTSLLCWFVLTSGGASAQNITVTLLGTGSPEPAIDRFGPSTLVQAGDQALVFDVGRGTNQRLAQVGLSVDRINAIFLTHLHSDHVVGIPDLWLTGWLRTRSNKPLNVFGPPGTTQMMEHLHQAFDGDIQDHVTFEPDLPRAGSEFRAAEVQPGVVYESQGVRVAAVRVEHTGVLPAFGYRVDYRGRSVVLSGDTRSSPDLLTFSAGATVLIHEVYDTSDEYLKQNPRTARVRTAHVSAAEAGEVFRRVHPKLAVYSHIVLRGLTVSDLVARTRSTYSGPLVVGEDLMRFIIGDEVSILHQ